MQGLDFIGFLHIWSKTDKRKYPANNLVIYVFIQHYFLFFSKTGTLNKKKPPKMSVDNEVFILVMEIC